MDSIALYPKPEKLSAESIQTILVKLASIKRPDSNINIYKGVKLWDLILKR